MKNYGVKTDAEVLDMIDTAARQKEVCAVVAVDCGAMFLLPCCAFLPCYYYSVPRSWSSGWG
jgi:hypothetical protein